MKKCCVIVLALALATGALVLCSIDWVGARTTSRGLMAIAFLLLGGVYCHSRARTLYVKYGRILILPAVALSVFGCLAYSTPLAMIELSLGGFLVGSCFVSKWLWKTEV